MNLGIVIGVENYKSEAYENLTACRNDARLIRDVLRDVKDFEEILYINNDEPAQDAKKIISDFIERNNGKTLKELVFYFSGHGERFGDDFFYLLSDFDRNRKESTGLRNSELDEWIRTLSPELCVKIVDACFSGTQYIKGESNTGIDLEKSAKKQELNNIYFLFSSRGDEASYAGAGFSKFTESILLSITNHIGDVRYREIIANVADDFSSTDDSKPIFVIQAGNIEKFGIITKNTHKIIYDAFGLESDPPNTTSNTDTEKHAPHETPINIFDKAIEMSDKICFSEEGLSDFISKFNSSISDWGPELKKLYDISVDNSVKCYSVPNAKKLGGWLQKNTGAGYFSEVTYDQEEYEIEEYRELPRKPSRSLSAAASLRRFGLWGQQDDTEYRLETLKKTRRIISGFEYTHSAENRILHIYFYPKIGILSSISLYIVPIYSNREMTINYSLEQLTRLNWSTFSSPECAEWKTMKVSVNAEKSASLAASNIKKDVEQWVLEKLHRIMDS